MAEDAKQKLELRFVPAEGEPDPALLDDLVRLIKQGIATASDSVRLVQISLRYGFHIASAPAARAASGRTPSSRNSHRSIVAARAHHASR